LFRWRLWRCGLVGVVALLATSSAEGQSTAPPTSPSAALSAPAPEAIYWRQNLFLIPYQWSSTTDPSSAEAVWLYVSKDRGANWQKISEAKPQVRAFNYHAEGDGEYWFAIRTIDTHGQSWPVGPMQAELKVIVDTTIPRFGDLSGAIRDGGTLEIQWQVADENLDPSTCKVEVQTDPAGAWQTVPTTGVSPASNGMSLGKASCQLPADCRTAAIRATVFDRAGNRAMYQTSINVNSNAASMSGSTPQAAQWPTLISGRGESPGTSTSSQLPNLDSPVSAAASSPISASPGWVSGSTPPITAAVADRPAATQPWPPSNAFASTAKGSAGGGTTGAEITFGNPQTLPIASDAASEAETNKPNSRFVAFGSSPPIAESGGASATTTHSPFKPLEPFRELAPTRATSLHDVSVASDQAPPTKCVAKSAGGNPSAPNDISAKWVNSRTFALEYELENVGERGVSKVELWGTRDNGQTWRSYGIDDDNRSPLLVTVDDDGLYGFRIVVDAPGDAGGNDPRPGDRPELWVGVDLHRPQVELTAAEVGSGDLAGQLLLRWRVDDEHLEPRPIGLFYSSRPAGPWSTIATNLENTGEYAWHVERHVPSRIYLRIEARDLAGNRAAYQTSDPVTIDPSRPSEGRDAEKADGAHGE
jgi:hypothetical protein